MYQKLIIVVTITALVSNGFRGVVLAEFFIEFPGIFLLNAPVYILETMDWIHMLLFEHFAISASYGDRFLTGKLYVGLVFVLLGSCVIGPRRTVVYTL